jgi:hypothetical protein
MEGWCGPSSIAGPSMLLVEESGAGQVSVMPLSGRSLGSGNGGVAGSGWPRSGAKASDFAAACPECRPGCQGRARSSSGRPLSAPPGQLALVGNSNRGLVTGTGSDTAQTVSVVSTSAALAHRPSVLGGVQASLFPRDLSFDQASGEVLVANYNSETVEEFPAPPLR